MKFKFAIASANDCIGNDTDLLLILLLLSRQRGCRRSLVLTILIAERSKYRNINDVRANLHAELRKRAINSGSV